MQITIPNNVKKYLKLVEELRDLCCEGYIGENYYPNMAEVQENLYDYILGKLGIGPECKFSGCQYLLDELEAQVKKGRKRKNSAE